MTETRNLTPAPSDAATYTLAIDWENGRTPTYETHLTWTTTEANARTYYQRNRHNAQGLRTALVGPDGRILTADAA